MFLDGARLANAAAFLGEEPARFTRQADLSSTCLSKGLGCPVGSLLLGSAERIEDGRRLRQALGGGMRQSGLLAAAGLLALERGLERLREDHRRARRLAEGLVGAPGCVVEPDRVQTNIVPVHRPSRDAEDVVRILLSFDVATLAFGDDCIRFVTHHDLDDKDVERAIGAAQHLPARSSAGSP